MHASVPDRITSILLLKSQLSVSDGSGHLIWAPYLRLAGHDLRVVDTLRWEVGVAGQAWSLHGIFHRRCWLAMVLSRQADVSGRLGTLGRCASTSGHSS